MFAAKHQQGDEGGEDCQKNAHYVSQITPALTERTEKCKFVKMESDKMGACDHPATNQPQSHLRFGSTLCYPAFASGLGTRSADFLEL
ncbi:hypothetical protein MFFC18_20930 [Mariniblastus fucicola]|uniref:Uncharacterized protein n=1 Tax=Mariniblastus fucicola TaxID=980251 RepID=A0A5B9P6J6_9BACT|nr:hypothetical protein MFFC18_20930 [Mariniblastus fucicola]